MLTYHYHHNTPACVLKAKSMFGGLILTPTPLSNPGKLLQEVPPAYSIVSASYENSKNSLYILARKPFIILYAWPLTGRPIYAVFPTGQSVRLWVRPD